MNEEFDESYTVVEKAELEKEQNLLGSSLLTALNFVPFKFDTPIYHVPKIVYDTTSWLLNSDLMSIKFINSPKSDGQLEQIMKKYQKGSQDTNILSPNEQPQIVWSILKTYINALPHYIISKSLIIQIYDGLDIVDVIKNLPQEEVSLIRQLLLLVQKMQQLSDNEFKILEIDKFFISLIFSYDPFEYDFVSSIFRHMCLKIKTLIKCCKDPPTPSLNYNEHLLKRFYRVHITKIGSTNLWLTDSRIIIYFLKFKNEFSLQISSIEDIKIPKRKKREILIIDKLKFKYCFQFDSSLMAHFLMNEVLKLLSSRSISNIFKFGSKESYKHIPETWGWDLYSPKNEYKRMKLIDSKNLESRWVLSKFNSSYEITTYPSLIPVLKNLTYKDFKSIVFYYLRNRIPIPVWHSSERRSLLLRSDVPNLHSVGNNDPKFFNKVTIDMKYLDSIVSKYKNKFIMSPTEPQVYYYSSIFSEWNFCYLSLPDNSSLQRYYEEFYVVNYHSSKARRSLNSELSQWHKTVSQVLDAGEKLAGILQGDSCVLLIHGPNYDVDFVISSIAQILYDEFYRSIRGFATLMEKDWCSYGFDFARKLAHTGVSSDYYDKKPILQLFFECVWQLIVKYYTQFEFTGSFLFDMLCNAYSLRFGTFTTNNDKEKELIKNKTVSYWAYVADTLNDDKYHWLNPLFIHQPLVLHVPKYKCIKVWYQLHETFEERIRELNINSLIQKRLVLANQPLYMKFKNYKSHDIPMGIGDLGAIIVSLDVSFNKITYIPMALFQLGHLQKLVLSYNPIGNLEPIHFLLFHTFLPNLKVLELANIQMTNLVDFFSYLSELKVLRIPHNSLVYLSPLSALVNLEILDVRANKLSQIDESICSLPCLNTLLAGENQINIITNTLSHISNLSVLDLNSNSLDKLSDGILKLKSLKILNLKNNNISKFPDTYKMINLLELNLNQNNFVKFPSLANLSQLKILHLANNYIEQIDVKIPSTLEELNLSHNRLKQVSSFILNLPFLKNLDLSHNELKKLHVHLPYKLSGLEVLRVSHNSLTLENVPSLGLMTNLKILDLKKNHYDYIPPTLSCLAGNLKRLKLDWCDPVFNSSEYFYEFNMEILKLRLSDNCKFSYFKVEFLTDKSSDSSSVINSIISFKKENESMDRKYFNSYTYEIPESTSSKSGQNRPSVKVFFFKNFDGYQDSLTFDESNLFQPGMYIIVWKSESSKEKLKHCLNIIRHKNKRTPVVLILCGSTDISKESFSLAMELNIADNFTQMQHIINYSSNKDVKNIWKVIENVIFKFSPMTISYRFSMLEFFFRSEWREMSVSVPFSYLKQLALDCMITDTLKAAEYLTYNGMIAFLNDSSMNGRLIVSRSYLDAFLTLLSNEKSPFHLFGIFSLNNFLKELIRKWKFVDIKCVMQWLRMTKSIFLFNPGAEIIDKAETISCIENRGLDSRTFRSSTPQERSQFRADEIRQKGRSSDKEEKLGVETKVEEDLDSAVSATFPSISEKPVSKKAADERKRSMPFHDKYIFIPWNLSEILPFNKPLFWSNTVPNSYIQFGRYYEFDVYPDALYYEFLSRVFNLMLFRCLWRTGAIFEDSTTKEVVFVKLKNRTVKIKVRTTKFFKLSLYIFEIMEAMRRTTKMACNVNVPCPHCANSKGRKTVFKLEECIRAEMSDQSYIICNSIWPVKTQAVIPDLSFLNSPELLISSSDLVYDRVVGEGGSAKVFMGYYKNKKIAIKKLRVDSPVEGEHKGDIMISTVDNAYLNFILEMYREMHFLYNFRHECLVGIQGVVKEQSCLVENFCDGGSLYNYLYDPSSNLAKIHPLTWPIRLKIAIDIAEGVYALHNHDPPIVHKDLKSPNILLISPSNTDDAQSWSKQLVVAQVSDFGIAGWVPTVVGREVDNPTWLAPEVMRGDLCNKKCDVYSFGVILYELLTGMQYFGKYEFMIDIEIAVLNGERPQIDPNNKEWNKIPEYLELMKNCWSVDPYDRPSFSKIILVLKYIISNYENGNVTFPPSNSLYFKDHMTLEESLNVGNFIFDIVKPKYIDSIVFEDEILTMFAHENFVVCGFAHGCTIITVNQIPDTNNANTLPSEQPEKTLLIDVESCIIKNLNELRLKQIFSKQIEAKKSRYEKFDMKNDIAERPPTTTSSDPPEKNDTKCHDFSGATRTDSHMEFTEKYKQFDSRTDSTLTDQDYRQKSKSPDDFHSRIPGIHEVKTNTRLALFSRGINGIRGLRFLGNLLCVSDMNHHVYMCEWDSKNNISLISSDYIEDTITFICTVEDLIVLMTKGGNLRWFDQQVLKWKEKKFNLGPFYCLVTVNSMATIWVGSEKKIVKLDYSFKQIGTISGIQYSITCMVSYKSTVWFGTQESVLQVWDATTSTLITSMNAHQEEITGLVVLRNTIFSCSKDGSIIIWDANHYTVLSVINNAHSDTVLRLESVCDTEVWSYSADKVIKRWIISPRSQNPSGQNNAASKSSSYVSKRKN